MIPNLRRVLIALVTLAILATALTPVVMAKGGGNAPNAKQCQKGGWETWFRQEDGSAFADQGACVDYASNGGTLVPGTPHLTLSPGTFTRPSDVGDLYIYTHNGPGTVTFTVTNSGTGASLQLGLQLQVYQLDPPMALSNDNCSSTVLNPGGDTCTFDVTFTLAGCDALAHGDVFIAGVVPPNPRYIWLAMNLNCPA